MEYGLFLFTHLGVPIVILMSMRWFRPGSRLSLAVGFIARVAPLCFLFLWGQYPLTGSYYLRYVLLGIILFIFIKSVGHWGSLTKRFPLNLWKYFILIPGAIIGLGAFYLCVLSAKGIYNTPTTGMNLTFPLQSGEFYISSGGNTSVVNNHFRSFPNSQQFAIDINELNSLGSVTSRPFAQESEKHMIYGRDIHCPCEGEVIDRMIDVPDNTTSSMQVDHSYGRGNYLDIRCDDLIVSLSHMQEGSVLPEIGAQLKPGQILGKVGNSGFSQEPHLHIQVAKYQGDSVLIGVPVRYDGDWLVRNDIVHK